VKIAQGIHPSRAFTFQNVVKFSVLGVLCPYRCTDGGETWQGGVDLRSTPHSPVPSGTEEWTLGPLLLAKFHPHRRNVSPQPGKKHQNCSPSN